MLDFASNMDGCIIFSKVLYYRKEDFSAPTRHSSMRYQHYLEPWSRLLVMTIWPHKRWSDLLRSVIERAFAIIEAVFDYIDDIDAAEHALYTSQAAVYLPSWSMAGQQRRNVHVWGAH
jgi:hypothetical protein